MVDEYFQKLSNVGTVLKVNNSKATYLIIKAGLALPNPMVRRASIVHEMAKIAFVGPGFDLGDQQTQETSFYEVKSGYMRVPFKVSSMSDVRHLDISTPLDVDMLPARVYHFRNYQAGAMLHRRVRPTYFLVDPHTEKETIIRIKTLYPGSRIILYNNETSKRVDILQGKGIKIPQNTDTVRAIDMIQKSNINDLSLNATFAARVFLRKLEWVNMRNLPFKFILNPEDIQNVLTFIQIMAKNEYEKEELEENKSIIGILERFYQLLLVFLSLDPRRVENFFANSAPPKQFIQPLIKIVQSQYRLRKLEHQAAEMQGVEHFFSVILEKLRNIEADTTINADEFGSR